ncbi:RES family NAD+ phosphorylase [Dyadobacter psychrotolerans]|uniref:RES domain-containing protein n=1 Tax=Dyadobacter psychrotolerans TaxID=2541721 RepID=A0A4R5DWS7_9BACT|nr:RES family NAD+ phosphorylase [Dyadobacter psychrotolerans]TDE16611.1 RES domain-containing protein [Dyadobacter psychrotolerans]
MIVYRLAAKKYIDDRSGIGAKLYGGRWNPAGQSCIYTSAHISLALLEKYVHAQSKENMERIALLKIEIPDNEGLIFHANETRFKTSWTEDVSYSQWLGGQILNDLSILAFTVPSAIIPSERNVIINPLSKDFSLVKFLFPTDFTTDFRLLNKLIS